MRRVCCLPVFVVFAGAAIAGETVKLKKEADTVVITIDGHEFTTYHAARSQRKPYFHPVQAADGATISRPLENPKDHPHHKGIWCAIDEVNGLNFWGEKDKIENVSIEIVKAEGNPAKFRTVNNWVDEQGKPLVRETVAVDVFASRLLVYDATFAALDRSVTFDDTKEGMFGIRLANTMRGQQGGSIVNAEGLKTENDCWGKESKWVDYYGPVAGKTYGVALFDDPQNFRKSRYHVRNYGLFTLSPFGQHDYSKNELPPAPLTLEPGKSFRLRYGLYLHDGDTAQGRVPEVYAQFVKAAK